MLITISLDGRCLFWAELVKSEVIGSVRGSFNGTIGNFTNGTINSPRYHWLINGTWRANGTICITIVTNGINGTIGRTLSEIGIPLVPLVEP